MFSLLYNYYIASYDSSTVPALAPARSLRSDKIIVMAGGGAKDALTL